MEIKEPTLKPCALPECDRMVYRLYGSCCSKSHHGKYSAKKKHGTLGLPNKTKPPKKQKVLKSTDGIPAQRRASLEYQRRKKRATPPWVKSSDFDAIYNEAKKISIETGINHEVDHIIPLKGEYVSGLHVPQNLQIITESENGKKFNHFIN
jgi:5-methylcytosine-specific restriction endonuclease McrA